MHDLQKIRQFLMGFPQWGDQPLTVDFTDGRPGSCGLFFMGREELSRQTDVQGNALVRSRYHFVLHRLTADENAACAQWLMDLQAWISRQSSCGRTPGIGCLPDREKVTTSDARLLRREENGCRVYQLRLQVDFDTYEEGVATYGGGI